MTRRIALAILLSVWTLLIIGGVGAYWVTRSALLRYLDESLFAYASSVPGLIHGSAAQPALDPLGEDRYRVVDDLRRTVAIPEPVPAQYQPKLLKAAFSYAQGQHVRIVTLQAYAAPTDGHASRPVTVVYTASAAEFDAKMQRLVIAYGLSGLVVGLLAAAVAMKVSRATLKPLAVTNQQIAAIDERNLDRRIDVAALPPELAPMAERLNELLARLQEAFVQRNRFLADASHELRTPVAALMTRLQVAARQPRSAEFYRELVEECGREAEQLCDLVEQLMQQVRSQNLSYQECAEELDVTALLRECVQTVMPLAEERHLWMAVSERPAMWCMLPPQHVRSALHNLLSNAVEYSRAGGSVEVDCHVEGDSVRIDVMDHGPGIAPQHLPNIFQPFYRADAARRRDAGHLGLGLSLVQTHMREMGGTCEVTSTVGIGSVFSLKWPVSVLSRQVAAPLPAAGSVSVA